MNLLPMLLACLLIGILATLAERRPADRALLVVAFWIVLIMALARGYYWNLFGRGHGFFSLNRVTAFVVFGAVFYGAYIGQMTRRRHAAYKKLGITPPRRML